MLAFLEAVPRGAVAVTSLAELRSQCRIAKEQLSYQSRTELRGAAPGDTVTLTRADLAELMSDALDGLIDALLRLLWHNRLHPAQLAAVLTMGGGARIPFVAQRLSAALKTPVVAVPRGQLTGTVAQGPPARSCRDETWHAVVTSVADPTAPVAGESPADGCRPRLRFECLGLVVYAATLLVVVAIIGLVISVHADMRGAAVSGTPPVLHSTPGQPAH